MKTIIQTKEKFEEFLNKFNFSNFSFDIETTGLNPRKDKLVGMGFYDGVNAYYIPVGHKFGTQLELEKIMLPLEKKFLFSEVILGHNIKFDMSFMLKHTSFELVKICNYDDTMLMHYLLDENSKHGLKVLVEKLLGIKMKTFQMVSKDMNASNTSIEQLGDYCMDDVIYTWKLRELFRPQLEEQKLYEYYKKIEMQFVKVIMQVEYNGVRLDINLLKNYTFTVANRLSNLKIEINKLFPHTNYQSTLFGNTAELIDVGSTKDMATMLFKTMKFEVLNKTDGGSPSLDMEHFEALYKKTQHPIFKLLIEFKKLQKLYTAYLIPYMEKQENGKIYPSILQHVVVTGRLSSSDPNIMQLPRPETYLINNEYIEIRKLLLPEEGYKIVAGDFSQEELRIAACLSNEQNLIDEFNKGFDMHLAGANNLFKLGLTEVQLKEGTPEYKEARKLYKKNRQDAKSIISFGILYGKNEYSFMKEFGMTEEEATTLISNCFGKYPKLKKCIEETHNQVKQRGYVCELFGRRRRFFHNDQGYYANATFRESFNFKIQGSAATILKLVCIKLFKELPEARILFTVHDEVVLQVKDESYLPKIRKIMENVVKLPTGLPADLGIGDCYGTAKV